MENAHATTVPAPPPVVPRPAFALWLYERNLNWREAAEALGPIHPETVRCYCLPYGDPNRRVPHQDILERIVAWTQGAITAGDFYPPHLQRQPADPADAGAS